LERKKLQEIGQNYDMLYHITNFLNLLKNRNIIINAFTLLRLLPHAPVMALSGQSIVRNYTEQRMYGIYHFSKPEQRLFLTRLYSEQEDKSIAGVARRHCLPENITLPFLKIGSHHVRFFTGAIPSANPKISGPASFACYRVCLPVAGHSNHLFFWVKTKSAKKP